MAIDVLWPESDPASAINNLNQTVFQLRRALDVKYRDGESPQYVVSTADTVHLNPDLVRTDLDEFRRLAKIEPGRFVETTHWADLVDLVRGEFLAELKYEDWVSRTQTAINAEIREALMPIALREVLVSRELAIRASAALIDLDEFDEAANVALARQLMEGGKRAAARDHAADFVRKLLDELGDAPSRELEALMRIFAESSPSTRS
jgi:DNA-binding SARP family transcriptional activator